MLFSCTLTSLSKYDDLFPYLVCAYILYSVMHAVFNKKMKDTYEIYLQICNYMYMHVCMYAYNVILHICKYSKPLVIRINCG
jgi:hypothetical protein